MNKKKLKEMIKEFCYKYNPPIKRHHGSFGSDFNSFLIKNECKVINEYKVIYRNVKANGEIITKKGVIDFFVFYNQKRFAIEFNNGNLLKLKSISKLLQSDSNYIIGIVRGNKRFSVLEQNRKKIIYVMKRLQLLNKPILLIINSEKTSYWIKNNA